METLYHKPCGEATDEDGLVLSSGVGAPSRLVRGIHVERLDNALTVLIE